MIGKPVVADGVIYFAPQDGYVYAVDTATGHIRWRFQRTVNVSAAVGIDGYPAHDGNTLVVPNDGRAVYALNAQSGKPGWHTTVGENGNILAALPTGAAPMVVNGVVYAGGESGVIEAFDEAAGNLLWKQPVNGAVDSAPTVKGGAVYVTTEKGSFSVFRAGDGALSWKYDDGGLISASVIVAP